MPWNTESPALDGSSLGEFEPTGTAETGIQSGCPFQLVKKAAVGVFFDELERASGTKPDARVYDG